MTCSCAGEVALFASKRLLATMNQHVCFQISSSLAWVAALIALCFFYILLKHLRFEFLGNLEGVISLNIHMSQYWLCSVCISVVDSFSSHCVAFNEPGNKAVRLFGKSETFRSVQNIFCSSVSTSSWCLFSACDISNRVESKLKSCSDNIWNTLLPGLQFPDVSIKSPKLTSLQCDQASRTSMFFDRGYKS